MGKWLRRIGVGLAVLIVIASVLALWQREKLTRLLAVNSLFSAENIVTNFSHMDRLFLTAPLPRGDGPVSPLPPGAPYTLPDDVQDWIQDRAVTALVVLHDGQLVHESYYLGTEPDDLRISWSMAKSFLSALTGVLVAEGAVDLSRPVTDYVPALAGSAYDGATVEDVLQMESGLEFDEDYLDFWSDINRMGRVLALGRSMDGFAAGQDLRRVGPGTDWEYVSIDTHVLGMVLRGATGRSATELMAERIIAPLGVERAPYYLADGHDTAFVLGGLNLTARDYARFGQMIAQGGEWQGRQVVPADWIDASTAASARTAPDELGYGYQWWIPWDPQPGEVFGRGIYGQYLWIDRTRNVVIVVTAADRDFREAGVNETNVAMLRRIAADL